MDLNIGERILFLHILESSCHGYIFVIIIINAVKVRIFYHNHHQWCEGHFFFRSYFLCPMSCLYFRSSLWLRCSLPTLFLYSLLYCDAILTYFRQIKFTEWREAVDMQWNVILQMFFFPAFLVGWHFEFFEWCFDERIIVVCWSLFRVSKGVRDIPGNLQSATSNIPSGKALMYFGLFMATGVFFIFMAFTLFLPVIVLVPQKFAICFTLGCSFIIGSFFALRGPKNQFAHMFSKEVFSFSVCCWSMVLCI